METFTIREHVEAKCMQFDPESARIGIGLYQMLGGRICPGCPKFNGGKCASLAQMRAGARASVSPAEAAETVRQEAERLGVSINEVRRRRRDSSQKWN